MGLGHDFDIVIIGAGISGIYAAKFYLDIHPDCRLAILDRDNCVGGTWNSRRGYDSFWTQWTVGTAEFSDLPMPRPPPEDTYFDVFKAEHTTKYLEAYVNHHNYAGASLRDRIKIAIEVKSILKANNRWTINTVNRNSQEVKTISTTKVIVASGLTSIANMPTLPGKESFTGPIIHQENFGSSAILTSAPQNITVLGGGKSSADMVYACVRAGKTVRWVFKETETTGPGFFLSPKGKGPYRNAIDIGMTRLAATFAPNFLNGNSCWIWALHSTRLGIRLMAGLWNAIDGEAKKEADFHGRGDSRGFEKLSPHTPIFWQNCTGGLLNQKDFFNTIAHNVHIHTGDIDRLENGSLILKNGESLPTDALLCGTGWVPSLQFFSPEQLQQFNLPHNRATESREENSHWTELESAADHKVVTTFPQLGNPPPHYQRPTSSTPYRLYKHIVPPSDTEDRSIAFIGQVSVGNYFPVVQCQAMWATAYLDRKLVLPNKAEQEKDVALFTAWCSRRYLSNGTEGNNMTMEALGYADGLLEQLGLSSHRKGWFQDLFAPFKAGNYAGLKDEYVTKYEAQVKEDKFV